MNSNDVILLAGGIVAVVGAIKGIDWLQKRVYKPVTEVDRKIEATNQLIKDTDFINKNLIGQLRIDLGKAQSELDQERKMSASIVERMKSIEQGIQSIREWMSGIEENKKYRQGELADIKKDIEWLEEMYNNLSKQLYKLSP